MPFSTSAQNFNIDLLVLYGTTEVYDQTAGVYFPAWRDGYTDWNRRMTELPVIRKSIGEGEAFSVGELQMPIADPYSTVYASLYASNTYPHGKPIAIYEKVAENPTIWMNAYKGLISSTERSNGMITLTCEDDMRNVLNLRFVPDYYCISTVVNGVAYGTVNDVIGTNVYTSDKAHADIIVVKRDGDSIWGAIGGFVVGAVGGFLMGGPAGAIVGAAGGALSGLPRDNGRSLSYVKLSDYNIIPDDTVLGGKPLKFYSGSVSGYATHTSGVLYNIPSARARGGTFVYGYAGTIEVDDILVYAKPGDNIYAELPLMYLGSPDTIIVNMLTGSNVSNPYSYPRDFSEDWFVQTEVLRHIDAWAVIDDFDTGGVAKSLSALCEEFGFSVYLDEAGKFAIRTIRNISPYSSSVIGTLNEGYNVTGNGFNRIDDIKKSYTDITFNFKDSVIGNLYDQKVEATMNAATYFGAIRRSKTINCQWMHDRNTVEIIATRTRRRHNGIVPSISADVSLYAAPFSLGEIISCTGWAVGTGVPYEVVGYTKDYQRSITQIQAECATYFYKNGFFSLGTQGTISSSSQSGWATLLASVSSQTAFGKTWNKVNPRDERIEFVSFSTAVGAGNTIVLDSEILLVKSLEQQSIDRIIYQVQRGMYNSSPSFHLKDSYIGLCVGTPYATVLNMATSLGTAFRWF